MSVRRSMRPLLPLALAGALTLTFTAVAAAFVFTAITDFNINSSNYTAYGSYSISSDGDGSASYRWSDSPSKNTRITGNSCSSLASLGSGANIGAGDTAYHGMFGGYSAGTCFVLMGIVTNGGSMTYYDGVLRR